MVIQDDSMQKKEGHTEQHFVDLLEKELPNFLAQNHLDPSKFKVSFGGANGSEGATFSFKQRDGYQPVSISVSLYGKNLDWNGSVPGDDVLARKFSEKIYSFIEKCSK